MFQISYRTNLTCSSKRTRSPLKMFYVRQVSSSRVKLILHHFQDDSDGTKISGVEAVQEAPQSHRPISVPEQSPNAPSLASGSLEEEETPVSSKDLGEWLRQHPTYTMDMAGFTPVNALHSYDAHLFIVSLTFFCSLILLCFTPHLSVLVSRRARSCCYLSSPSPSRSAIAVETPTRST